MDQFKTEREKIAAVLADIEQNYRLEDAYQADGHQVKKIGGQIAANVAFNGEWHTIEKSANQPYQDNAEVNLQAKGQKLAKLNVTYNFGAELLRPHANELLPHRQQFDAWEHIAEVAVTSPAWQADNGVVTESETNPKLKVLHTADETATAVVAQIHDTVQRSHHIANVTKKLAQLDLPTAAAEGLVDLVYHLAEKSQTNEPDNDRERSNI